MSAAREYVLTKSEEQFGNVVLLKYLGFDLGNKRMCYSQLKILYQLHLYSKNVERQVWNHVHVSLETFANHSGLSEKSVKRFLCSDKADLFVDIKRGKRTKRARFTSNAYYLKKEFVEIFSFLERFGFFKGYGSGDHVKWRKGFNSRLERWLLPTLESGKELSQICHLKAKLSTTKRPAVEVAKRPCTTNPRGLSSFTTLKDLNPVRLNPILEDFSFLEEALRTRLSLKEWEIRALLGKNTLPEVWYCTNEVLRWIDTGTVPRGAGLIWSRLNKRRKERNYNRRSP